MGNLVKSPAILVKNMGNLTKSAAILVKNKSNLTKNTAILVKSEGVLVKSKGTPTLSPIILLILSKILEAEKDCLGQPEG